MILETSGLTKTYTRRTRHGPVSVAAVRGIDLVVKECEIFGILGPNGAGKSTLLSMLTTLVRPDGGEAMVAGMDLLTQSEEVRANIGAVQQAGGLFPWGTPRSEIALQCRLQGLGTAATEARVPQLIDQLGLTAFADRQCGQLSGGERRRVEIALGVVTAPKLLFLDEPTVGLDPVSRAQLWGVIRDLREEGMAIIVTTHYLDEADVLCDRVAVIDAGQVVTVGSPEELKREVAGDRVEVTLADPDAASAARRVLEGVVDADEVNLTPSGIQAIVKDGERSMPTIVSALVAAGLAVSAIGVRRVSLDDVFLAQTGRTLADVSDEHAPREPVTTGGTLR